MMIGDDLVDRDHQSWGCRFSWGRREGLGPVTRTGPQWGPEGQGHGSGDVPSTECQDDRKPCWMGSPEARAGCRDPQSHAHIHGKTNLPQLVDMCTHRHRHPIQIHTKVHGLKASHKPHPTHTHTHTHIPTFIYRHTHTISPLQLFRDTTTHTLTHTPAHLHTLMHHTLALTPSHTDTQAQHMHTQTLTTLTFRHMPHATMEALRRQKQDPLEAPDSALSTQAASPVCSLASICSFATSANRCAHLHECAELRICMFVCVDVLTCVLN